MIKTFYFFIFWISLLPKLCMASYTASDTHKVTPILIDTVKGGYKSSVAPIYGYSSHTSVKSNNDTPMEVVDADNISSTKLSSGIPFELVNGQTVQRSYAYITFSPIKLKAGISHDIIRDGLRIQFGKGDANINGVTYEKDRIKSIAAYYRGSSITFLFDVTDYITGSGMYWLADPEFLHPSYYSYDANHATDPSFSTYDIGDPRTVNNASYWGMYTIYEDENEDIYKEMRFFLPQLSIFSLSPNIIHDIELEYFTPLQSELEGELYVVYNDAGVGPVTPGRRFWFDRNLMLHDSEALIGGKLYSQGGTETFHMPRFSTLMLGEGLASRSFPLSEFDSNHTFEDAHKAVNTDSNGRFPVLGRSSMDQITQKPQRVTSSFGQLASGDGVDLSTMVFSVNVFAPSTDLIELEARDLNGGSAIPGDEIVLRYQLLNQQGQDFDSAEEVKLHIPMEYTVYSGEDITVEIPAGKFAVSPSDILTTENNLLVINLPNLLPGESYEVEIPLNVGSNVTQSARSQFDSYMSSIGPVTNTEYTTDITDRNEKSWVEYDGIDISIKSITRNGFDSIVTTTEDLLFHVEFSHEVDGVDTQDFIIQGSGKAGVFVEGVNRISATEYLITAEHSLTPGYIQLDIDGYASIKHLHSDNILDTSRNPSKYESYQVKKYAESVTVSGGQEIGNRNQVSFVIDFGERINGEDKTDFELGGTIANGATIYDVTCNIYGICTIVVNIPDKTGTLSIGLSSSHNLTRVSDGAGISDELPTDSEYFTKTPLLTDITRNGKPESVVGANEFKLVFSHDVIEVTIDDFVLAGAAAVGSSIQSVAPLHQGTAQEYLVTIDHGKEAGFLYLELAPNHDISSNGIRVSKAVNVESYVNPILIQSITRQLTDTDIHGYADVSFVVDFGDEVSNVDETDFEVSGDVTAVINPTQCNSSGVCIVNVTPGNETGILELRIGSSHNIERASDGTPLNPQIPSVYQHYERAPRLEKINRNGRSEVVSIAQNVDFKVVFSHPVQGVTIDDFELVGASRVGSSIKDVTPTNQQYYVVQVAHSGQSGRLTLQLKDGHNITSNTLVPIVDLVEHEEYVFEVPVQSIIREDESPEIGTKSQVIFNFSFGSEVEHADTADFVLNGTAAMGAFIDDVTCGQDGVCHVFVEPGADTGFLSIELSGSHNIVRKSDQVRINPASPTASQHYQRAPKLERITRMARSEYTQGGTVEFDVKFSHAVEKVDTTDFELEGDSAAGSVIKQVILQASGSYLVSVVHSGHHGVLGLALKSSSDVHSNNIAVLNQPSTSEQYILKLPIVSITRHGLAQELRDSPEVYFAVTFAERVTNVSNSSFELIGAAANGATLSKSPVCDDRGVCVLTVTPSGNTGHLGIKVLDSGITRYSDGIPVDITEPLINEIYQRSPELESVSRYGADMMTEGGIVYYKLVFDRHVEFVDVADFVLQGDSAATSSITSVSVGTGEEFLVEVQHSGEPGELFLHLDQNNNIRSNGLGVLLESYVPPVFEHYELAPKMINITRVGQSEVVSSAGDVVFAVEFDFPVSHVSLDDFILVGSSGVSSSVKEVDTSNNSLYLVTIGHGGIAGRLTLDLKSDNDIEANNIPVKTALILQEEYIFEALLQSILIDGGDAEIGARNQVVFTFNFGSEVESALDVDFKLGGKASVGAIIDNVDCDTLGLCRVFVTPGTDTGYLSIELSGNHNIVRKSDQVRINPASPTASQQYQRAPKLERITRVARSEYTQGGTVEYDVFFSHAVEHVDVNDFILEGDSAPDSSISDVQLISTSQYRVSVEHSGHHGKLVLKLTERNNIVSNQIAVINQPMVTEAYVLKLPILSITRDGLLAELGDENQVRFAVNFADRVSYVSADDFELTGLAAQGAKILSPVCNDEGLCIVAVKPSGKTGALGLKLSLSNNISRNSDDIPVDTATPAVYEEYHRSPVLLSATRSVTNEITQGGQVDFVVTFDRAIGQVDEADFVLEGLSAPGAKIVDVQTSNNEVFRVVVEHSGVPGKLLLGLSDTNNIESNGVKLLVNDYAQEFYMLKPDVISILRTADIELGSTYEIEFKVNFGVEVTQFDPTDFQLSGSVSIGAKITEVVCEASGECFVHVETNPDTGVLGLALSPQHNIMRASDDTLFSDVVLGETQHYQRAPTLKVIARHELPHETMGGEVQYVAIFSHHMENVDIDDFVLQGVPAENSMITAVNQTEPGVYVVDVTHSGQAGQLYLRLSEHRTLSSNQIDLLGVAQAYEDFIHYPSIDEIRIDTSKNNQYSTDIDLLDFHLLFSDPVVGLSVEDLILVGKAAEGSSIDSIEQVAQNQYLVKVRYAGVDYGDLTLKLVKYDAVREFDDGTLINSDEPSVWEKYNIQKPVYNAENSSSGGSLGFYILCFMFILSISRHWPWTRNHFSRT